MNDTILTTSQSKNHAPTKLCYRCKRNLHITEFYKNNQRKDGLTGNCRECMSTARKKWDQKYNRSKKGKETAKRYYYSEKGQVNKKAYRKAYKMTPEQKLRYRLKRREQEKQPKYKARMRRYWQSEKGKATKARKDKRYARTAKGKFSKRKTEIKRKHQIKTANCTLTKAQWQERVAEFNHTCVYCGIKLTKPEVDHVIPLSRGGHHTRENVVPACRTCNAKKGDKILPEEIKEAFGI